MNIEPQLIQIAAIVFYGVFPVPLCLFAYWLAGRSAKHVWAKRVSILLPMLGIAFCVWFYSNFRISKYPLTDFIFGFVLMLWLAAIGGILGGIADRIGESLRQQASRDKTVG